MFLAALIPAFILILFGVLKIYYPYKQNNSINSGELFIYKKKFLIFDIIGVILFFIFIGLFTYIYYLTANKIQHLINKQEPYDLILNTNPFIWAFIGLFFAMIVAPNLISLIYKLLFKNIYEKYIEFNNRKYGWDGIRSLNLISIILLPIIFIISILLFDSGIKLRDERIYINQFLSLKDKTYDISDINSIKIFNKSKAISGKIVADKHYNIYFKDGFIWKPSSFIFIEKEIDHLIEYIQKKGNIITVEVDLDDE